MVQTLFSLTTVPQGVPILGQCITPNLPHLKFLLGNAKAIYRRSVLHRAALAAAAHSLPPPKNGSLRQAALACFERQQADQALQVNNKSARKRPLSGSPSAPSPSNNSPLSQRIRADLQLELESEVESPERELLRSRDFPENPLPISPPSVKGFPPPAPLVFSPSKFNVGSEIHANDVTEIAEDKTTSTSKAANIEKVESVENVEVDKVFETAKETVEEKEVQDTLSEEKRAEMKVRIRFLEEALRLHKLEKDKTPKCLNCGEIFAADHQCSVKPMN